MIEREVSRVQQCSICTTGMFPGGCRTGSAVGPSPDSVLRLVWSSRVRPCLPPLGLRSFTSFVSLQLDSLLLCTPFQYPHLPTPFCRRPLLRSPLDALSSHSPQPRPRLSSTPTQQAHLINTPSESSKPRGKHFPSLSLFPLLLC